MAARKVILYFDDQVDALRFALAAGSVMSGEPQEQRTRELVQEVQRAHRIRLGAFKPVNSHSIPEPTIAS